jgi:hypothetical protein
MKTFVRTVLIVILIVILGEIIREKHGDEWVAGLEGTIKKVEKAKYDAEVDLKRLKKENGVR